MWLPLVGLHPETFRPIPGLADRWALSADGKTVFYHLDPEAAYSDGRIVKAQDFLLNICLRTSGFARDPFWTTLFRSMYDQITVYGDSVIALTLPSRGPLLPYMACADFHPAHPGFTMISMRCFWNATSGKSLQIRVATWLFPLKSG